MAFRRVSPNLAAFDGPQRQHISAIMLRLDALESRGGAVAVDLDKHAPIGSVPPAPSFDLDKSGAGKFVVRIQLPQDKIVKPGRAIANPIRAGLMHRLKASLTPNFDSQGDVETFGPSTQTYWEISTLGTTPRHWRIESSYDGVNWSQSTVKGPVSAA